MANLKDLRKRIQVVKSTKKITSAMKLVATSYVKKAEERYQTSQEYKRAFQKVTNRILDNYVQMNLEKEQELITGRKGNKHLIILLSADRGLCGGFNGNIGRYASNRIEELKNKGKDVQIFCIGKKAIGAMKANHKTIIVKTFPMPTDNHYHETVLIAEEIIKNFYKEEFDTCEILYNQFKSILACLPAKENLIPISQNRDEIQEKENTKLFEIEPTDDLSIENIMKRFITAQLFAAVFDSQVSEQSSRMMAMDNASRNAEELIDKLELQYNRTRQAIITSELMEIISGAEAL
jgi:F-type H+-transporting ATPase subunit gamma